MKRIIVAFCLLSCMLLPISTANEQGSDYWEVDLDNGYISTKPIIVDEQVIVRTSGFWTGEDRPHVYAFDLDTGQENWRFKNTASTNHDMTLYFMLKQEQEPAAIGVRWLSSAGLMVKLQL